MAVRDVKEYYLKMLAQYTQMKTDLADFDQALKEGHITEDQLAAAKADVDEVEKNYQRLTYIMYLLQLPNRRNKKEKYKKSTQSLQDEFSIIKADANSVIRENDDFLKHFKEEMNKKIKETK